MVSNCAKWLEVVCATLIKSAERRRAPSAERRAPSAERRAPSAEAMTAPRAREQADPPSPPDRLPPRRGGSPSSKTASAAARPAGFARLAGARRGLVRSARALAAAACLSLAGALAFAAEVNAQDITPPTLEGGFVWSGGNGVTLTFSEDLSITLRSSDVILKVDGQERTRAMGASFAVDDNQLKLSDLDPLIRKGQTVTVSYTDPSPGDDTIAIQDEAGNDAASFANVEMLNNSDADPVNPDPPTGLSAAANSKTAINLNWTAPVDRGGRPITGYKIEASTDGSTNWFTVRANTGNSNTRYSHGGLNPSSTRHYRVSTITSIGTSSASGTANATTDPPSHHAAPDTIDGTVTWSSTLTVGKGSTGVGDPITGYRFIAGSTVGDIDPSSFQYRSNTAYLGPSRLRLQQQQTAFLSSGPGLRARRRLLRRQQLQTLPRQQVFFL